MNPDQCEKNLMRKSLELKIIQKINESWYIAPLSFVQICIKLYDVNIYIACSGDILMLAFALVLHLHTQFKPLSIAKVGINGPFSL